MKELTDLKAIVETIVLSDIEDEALERLIVSALLETAQRDPRGFMDLAADAVAGNHVYRDLLDLLPNPPSRLRQ